MMTLREALEGLAAARGDRVVVTTMASVGVWPQLSDTPRDFAYLPSSMGQAVPLGLGLALAKPGLGVIVVSGDGGLLMNLGCLVTLKQGLKELATAPLIGPGAVWGFRDTLNLVGDSGTGFKPLVDLLSEAPGDLLEGQTLQLAEVELHEVRVDLDRQTQGRGDDLGGLPRASQRGRDHDLDAQLLRADRGRLGLRPPGA